MKISTRLRIAALVPAAMALVIGAALLLSYRTVDAARVRSRTAHKIIIGTYQLNSLAQSYMLHQEERPKLQFLATHDSVMQLTATMSPAGEERDLLEGVRRDCEAMKALFLELAANNDHNPPIEPDDLMREAQERLAGQLFIRSGNVISDASRLDERINDSITSLQRRVNVLILTLILITTGPLTVILLGMIRGVSYSLEKLREGTAIVGAGNLDHRIGGMSPDEIGDLGRSFDRMTEQLQEVTVSKLELQNEVELRRRSQEELGRQREWLRVTLSSIGDAVVAADAAGRIAFINPVASSLTGWNPQEALGCAVSEICRFINEETGCEEGDIIAQVLREKRPVVLANHATLVARDGRQVPIEDSAAPILDAAGEVVGAVLVFHDVTQRRRSEAALREAHERARWLARFPEENPNPVLRVSAAGSVLYANPAAASRPGWECTAGASAPQSLKLMVERAMVEGKDIETTVDLAGTPYAVVAAPIASEGYANLYALDVTDRLRVESERDRIAGQRQLALNAARLGWWHYNPVTHIATWDKRCQEIFDISGYERLYEEILARLHPDDLPRVRAAVEAALNPQHPAPYAIEYRVIPTDGTERWVEAHGVAQFEGEGDGRRAVSLVGTVADITQRRKADDALRSAKEHLEQRVQERTAELSRTVETLQDEVMRRIEAEKILRERSEQLRTLASELTLAEQRERRRLAQVLHDELQQFLVGARYRMSRLDRSSDSAVRRVSMEVQDLIAQSLTCSRNLTGELCPPILHLGGLVPALEWLAVWMKQKHDLEVELAAEGNSVPVSEDITILLFQSVRELLFNAVKHAGVHAARLRVRQAESHIEISVQDEGKGFDPGESLHEARKAGGFGLFSVRERLILLGGELLVDSAPGRGSRFTLRAPLVRPAAEADKAAEASAAAQQSKPDGAGAEAPEEKRIRVLLVDDHIVVRQGLSLLLREEPDIHVVGEASDGATAVELVRRLSPDVVTMDINMPGMNGVEATRIIHREFPAVRVIALSMAEDGTHAEELRQAGAADYLSKSAPADAMLEAIRGSARFRSQYR